MKRDSISEHNPPALKFRPWYGTENMETERQPVTTTGGPVTYSRPNSEVDMDQQKLWANRCYVNLIDKENATVSEKFKGQISLAEFILKRKLRITVLNEKGKTGRL